MRGVLAVALCGCGFKPTAAVTAPVDSAPILIDVAIDAQPPPDPCAGTLLCLTFDPNPLPAMLPNGGTAPVSAVLTNIVRGQGVTGGAAELSSTSEIYVPSVPQLSGVLAYDYWIRIDQAPSVYGRAGVLDTGLSGFDSFYYVDPEGPQLRCSINSNYLYAPVTAFSGWTHVACSCDASSLTIYVNGVVVGTGNENCAAGATSEGYGLEVGADNIGGPGYTGDILQGALDDVRLYTTRLTASQVCKLAGTC